MGVAPARMRISEPRGREPRSASCGCGARGARRGTRDIYSSRRWRAASFRRRTRRQMHRVKTRRARGSSDEQIEDDACWWMFRVSRRED